MTYRLDPQLDKRLARLVAGLPAHGAPSVPGREPAPDRVPRIVLVVVAILLVLGAIASYIWLINSPPLPNGASLRCDDIDPFRCRGSAISAVQWTTNRLAAVRSLSPARIHSAEVWRDTDVCRDRLCPAAYLHSLERTLVVKIGYAGGGQDWVTVLSCDDGTYQVGGSTLGPVSYVLSPPPPCIKAP
jgi:hypothetical protein